MMFTISILTTLLLPVALVQSAPGLDLDLTTRDASCPGNQEWCGWTKSCKCDKDYIWDNKNQKCHYPAWPQYNCPQGQKYYCGKSETEYCEYGKSPAHYGYTDVSL